jgi:hypothetical protein
MERWTKAEAQCCVYNFGSLIDAQRTSLLDFLNAHFPPAVYRQHRARQQNAVRNTEHGKSLLSGAEQKFPRCIRKSEMSGTPADLTGYAIVLTAGGDGERLRASLRELGASDESLRDFTKATFPLPGLPQGYGSLQANCAVIADLCRHSGLPVPVIITTGPAYSATAKVIPETLQSYGNFGLANIRTIAQDERLHLTAEGLIVAVCEGDLARPAVNPDETGGPFVKLSAPGEHGEPSAIEWLRSFSCKKIIALQATGLYDPSVILAMAAAGKQHDCVGVGILRTTFPPSDPFGTFVIVKRDGRESLAIVEQGIRNDATRGLTDETGQYHLPYNTGLYVFDTELLAGNALPDYATPPKEILPSLPRSPKIGYAITDIMPLAHSGAVLAVEPDSYENIKSAGDLPKLAALAQRFGIVDLCK